MPDVAYAIDTLPVVVTRRMRAGGGLVPLAISET